MAKRPLFPSELDLPRRLVFLALAESDMRQSMQALEMALKHGKRGDAQSEQYLALSEIGIIRYARPFCANRVVTDDPKKICNVVLGNDYVPSDLHQQAADLHEHVIQRRQSIVAHSDMRNRNIVLTRDASELAQGGWYANVHCTFLAPLHMANLRAMAGRIAMRLHNEIAEAAQSRFGHLPLESEVQIGGGNPKYVAALQEAWMAKRAEVRRDKLGGEAS